MTPALAGAFGAPLQTIGDRYPLKRTTGAKCFYQPAPLDGGAPVLPESDNRSLTGVPDLY